MSKIERFEDLEIWQIAKSIAVETYAICDLEPLKSDWGLKDQLRRAAMYMSDNIAEGFEYNHNPDFIRYLIYAKGSSGEFRNKLIILNETSRIDHAVFSKLYDRCVEFSRKTKKLINYLKDFEKNNKQSKIS